MSSTASTTSTARQPHRSSLPPRPPQAEESKSRIQVTPSVLRNIFADSRSPHEERSISRVAFFRFAGFLLSVIGISLAAARSRGIKSGAALLGVV